MANQIPIRQEPPAAGGYLLPPEQGDILVNGLLRETGALAISGDSRATTSPKTQFPIWLGQPTASMVGEGAPKPVTGAEFAQAVMNVKKVASIVMFTDEMLDDVQGGDLNVLVDSGVREAIADEIDAHATGKRAGVNFGGGFDSMLRATTAGIEFDEIAGDGLQRAVSAGMGYLEGNGYGNPAQMAVLLGFGFAQLLRDARSEIDSTLPIYGAGTGRDPIYGLANQVSTNLNRTAEAPSVNNIVGFVVHRPNLHVRLRRDVTLTWSKDATLDAGPTGGGLRNMFQEDLTAVRYETRLAFMIHDLNRAVVAIRNASVSTPGDTRTLYSVEEYDAPDSTPTPKDEAEGEITTTRRKVGTA